jgi:hypothetical protein
MTLPGPPSTIAAVAAAPPAFASADGQRKQAGLLEWKGASLGFRRCLMAGIGAETRRR